MTRLLSSSLALLAAAVAAPSFAAGDNPLQAERWNTRPLVVVAPQADDPVLRQLDSALQEPANREAFVEREMVLYTVIDGQATRNEQALSAAQSQALLQALSADAKGPATVYLVGKDGTIKMRQLGQLAVSEIFATIDRMPMRQ